MTPHLPVVVRISSVTLVTLSGPLFVELAVVGSNHLSAVLSSERSSVSRSFQSYRLQLTLGPSCMRRSIPHSCHTARPRQRCRRP